MRYEDRAISDRVLLLGLDGLYRLQIKRHESGQLRRCAEEVSNALSIPRGDVPVEGYYTETPELRDYFLLMRGLQEVEEVRRREVASLASYQRLLEITSSPLFGVPARNRKLLPTSQDPLYFALKQIPMPKWSVTSLLPAAMSIAESGNDCSLVGLGVLTGDAVVATALRESVALYAGRLYGYAQRAPIRYLWNVSDAVASRTCEFVDRFNALFDEPLPAPRAENAEEFWNAHTRVWIDGRCASIGVDDSVNPHSYFHWAIRQRRGPDEFEVQSFWDAQLWTTETYRSAPSSPRSWTE